MKTMKKLASVLLALVMVMALAAPAFATPSSAPTTGTVTVKNASKGETYKIYQVLDAVPAQDGAGVTYDPQSIPDELNASFGSATWPVFVEDVTNNTVKVADNVSDAQLFAALKEWAKTQEGREADDNKTADGGDVVFTVPYGYYVVISSIDSGNQITVDSTKPNVTVYDKNNGGSTPEFPTDGKTVNESVVGVGDTVTYTVKYNTVNWVRPEKVLDCKDDTHTDDTHTDECYRAPKADSTEDERVISYTISDTLPNFLTDVNVTSIKIMNGTTEIGDVTKQFTNKSVSIDWATLTCGNTEAGHVHGNDCYTSNYSNGAQIVITYTAKVTDAVLDNENANGATNKVSVTYDTTKRTGNNGDETEKKVYTAEIVIDKYAKNVTTPTDKSKKLAGAKFILGRTVVDTPADVNAGTEAVTHTEYYVKGADNKITWSRTESEATPVTTDANGVAKFDGLGAGDGYFLKETEAPAGYNKLTTNIPVEEISSNANATAKVTITTEVENSTGAELPSTGGIGTTIFYVGGGILIAAAGILLITKKRMGKAD